MTSPEERCAEFAKLQRIDDAFRAGDLEALRAALDDPSIVPNGPMPLAVGACLIYAVYHSPLAFIRALLELGADPDVDEHDGFPPMIAALSCTSPHPGTPGRPDVLEVLQLLLEFGASRDQRGLNDWTALHMAVAERNAAAVRLLLEAGADPRLRTRIDDYETPREMAEAAGLAEIARLLEAAESSWAKR